MKTNFFDILEKHETDFRFVFFHCSSSELIKVLENEWLPWAVSNKDGQGDKSGDMPQGALDVAGQFFIQNPLVLSVSLTRSFFE